MRAFIAIFAILAVVSLFYACSPKATEEKSADHAPPSKDSLVKRGAYLVTTIGCNDCHSPKKMGPNGPFVDTALALSGFHEGTPVPVLSPDQAKTGMALFAPDLTAAAGPWGTTFSANITSDATGIGNWTLDQFKNALRNGKYMGLKEERPLMPPMPWEELGKLNNADMEAIFTYLKSTRPVKNMVPSYRPPGK